MCQSFELFSRQCLGGLCCSGRLHGCELAKVAVGACEIDQHMLLQGVVSTSIRPPYYQLSGTEVSTLH